MAFNLQERLAAQQQAQRYRRHVCVQSPQGPRIQIDGRDYLAFASNDYLGLASHPQVIEALQQGAQRWGVGGGAAHLVTGHMQPHAELAQALADWTGREAALLFGSGYQANLAVLTALLQSGDCLLHDRLNHASLLDGGRLSAARFQRYLHNDMQSLAGHLQRCQGDTLIATDGVFSMDGDIAKLPEICRLAAEHPAWVMVDDAHGLGVLGNNGAGTLEHFGLDAQQVPVLMGTLGKALGTAGAFVAGSHTLIETLTQFARPYIYTTSSSPALACATLASVRLARTDHERRQHLQGLIRLFRHEAGLLGLPLMDSPTAIQPLRVGDSGRALAMSQRLRELGIWVTAIRPPTVPEGGSRLRITLTAAHSPQQVEQLLTALALIQQELTDGNH